LFPESLSYSAPIRIKQTCALDRPRRKRVKSRPHKSKKGLIFRFLAPTTTSRKKNHLAVKQVQEPQIDRAPPEISTTTNPISSGQSALNPGHTKHGREGGKPAKRASPIESNGNEPRLREKRLAQRRRSKTRGKGKETLPHKTHSYLSMATERQVSKEERSAASGQVSTTVAAEAAFI
jgi:hypothetical protein